MAHLHQACIVCGEKNISVKYIINGFHILRCKSCALLFVAEKLSPTELSGYYENAGADYVYADPENVQNLKFYYDKLKDLIAQKIPRGRVLDVGCSQGQFLDALSNYECYGIEFESSAAQKAKAKYGKNIYIGRLEDYVCPNEFFDVITLQDVLDHLPDPLQALRKCHALLKPNGLIVIKAHNIGCLYAKLTGSKFYALVPPGHMAYFSRKSITRALTLSGFKIQEYRYLAHRLFLKTIFYRLTRGKQRGFFYWCYKRLEKIAIGKIKINKNLHDIFTILARKCSA